MKRLLLLAFICQAFTASAQKIDFALSAGTGKSYIVEDHDINVNVDYGVPLSLITELKFTPKNKNWGIKLRLHSVESTVTGVNWTDNTPLDGYINSMTVSLLLENEITRKNVSYGYNFGIGTTKETVQPLQFYTYKNTINYASISLGGLLSLRLCKDFDFQLQPILLWQDPFKSIGTITKVRSANFAGEDLTAVVNLGIRYKFRK